jgi:acyl carrier protein
MTKSPGIETTEDAILDEVVGILVEVIGEDFLLDVEVTADTSFNDDLAVESIEFVALAEKLRERYGEKVDFVAFVGEMDLEEIVAMTVGRLVTHIHQCIEPETESGGANHG